MNWVMIFVFQIIAANNNNMTSTSLRHQHQVIFQFFISLLFSSFHSWTPFVVVLFCTLTGYAFKFIYSSVRCTYLIFDFFFVHNIPKKTKLFRLQKDGFKTVIHSSWVKFFSFFLILLLHHFRSLLHSPLVERIYESNLKEWCFVR